MMESPERGAVARYDQFQALLPVVQSRIVAFLGEEATAALFTEAASRLRPLLSGQLLVGDPYEVNIVADHAYLDLTRDGKNAVRRYLDAADPPPEPQSDEAVLLDALTRSQWTVLEIVAPNPGVGLIGTDELTGGTRVVVAPDEAGMHAVNTLVAMRLISLPELAMPSGSVIPISLSDQQRIFQALDERFPYRKRRGLSDLTAHETADLNAIVATTALAAMDAYVQTIEDLLAMLPEPEPSRPSTKPDRLPRGHRPKSSSKPKKKSKRR